MSIFKTRLRPLDKKAGTIQNKLDGLKVTITPLSDMANVTITPKRVFNASVLGGLFSFVSEVKPFHLLYRWGEYFGNIWTALRAEGEAAPAVEADVENNVGMALKAEASANEAAEAKVENHPGFALLARAVSYITTLATYMRYVGLGLFARPVAAPGAAGENVKDMPLEVMLDATGADAAEAELVDTILTGLSASGCQAPTVEDAGHESVLVFARSAEAGTAEPALARVENSVGVALYANAMAWGYQVINGVLRIPYSYQAMQTGSLLFLGTIPENWAEPYLDDSGALIIGQSRLARQEENILEVI